MKVDEIILKIIVKIVVKIGLIKQIEISRREYKRIKRIYKTITAFNLLLHIMNIRSFFL